MLHSKSLSAVSMCNTDNDFIDWKNKITLAGKETIQQILSAKKKESAICNLLSPVRWWKQKLYNHDNQLEEVFISERPHFDKI